MKTSLRRWFPAILASAVAFGGSASTGQAQINFPIQPIPVNPNFQVAPGLTLNQAAYNTAVMGRAVAQVPPYAFGFNPYQRGIGAMPPVLNSVPYIPPGAYPGMAAQAPTTATLTTNPYGFDNAAATNPGNGSPYSGYSYPSYGGEDPAAGFLRGTSDVIRATGDYYKAVQSARITQTTADEGRVDYRRRLIDEARYERGLLPTTEELRQAELNRDLARARHQPPVADIISAKSLNDILNHLRSDPTLGKGQNVPIEEDVLKRINVANPTSKNASVGLLKDEGKLQWAAPLAAKEFDTSRNHLSRTLEDVVQGLKFSNPVEPGKLKDLGSDLEQLQKQVEKSELSPSDYIEAKGYLDQVDAAVRALKDPNVSSIFNHKFSAKNVAELVDGMKGMDFAPAAPGDEWAYRVLQQALVSYDYTISPQQSPPRQP